MMKVNDGGEIEDKDGDGGNKITSNLAPTSSHRTISRFLGITSNSLSQARKKID